VQDGTHTTSVASLGDHSDLAYFEFKEVYDFTRCDVNLDDIVDLNSGVGISDGAAIVCNYVRDLLVSKLLELHAAKLVALLLIGHAVKHEAALGVIDKTELVAGVFELDDVHETSREVGVSADFAVNLHLSLHADHLGLLAGEGILQAISENQD